jgi:hypothetical protein
MDTHNHYAPPHPELIIPTPRLRTAPAPELLAQIVAVLLLLVAWVVMVWVVSTGLVGSSDLPEPVNPEPQPAYVTA